MPKVSVIIPTYNCAKYLRDTVESVLSQSFQDFEIIIVDDGSTDNTKETISKLGNDQRIIYISQENKGQACARNTGLKMAKGDYIALLDADDKWLPNRLEEAVAALDNHPDVGLVHAHSLRITEDNKPIETIKRDPRFLSGSLFETIFLRQTHISCPTATFRRECLDTVGLMDENRTCLGNEDREYWLRVSQRYPVLFIDKVLAHYRVRENSVSKDTSKMFKARLYVVDKFVPEGGQRQRLRRLALAKIYHDYGDEFLIKGNFKQAREQYKKSLSNHGFSLWTIVNLIKCSLKG